MFYDVNIACYQEGDLKAPPDEVASFYRLLEVERSNEEGSLYVAVHRSNP